MAHIRNYEHYEGKKYKIQFYIFQYGIITQSKKKEKK